MSKQSGKKPNRQNPQNTKKKSNGWDKRRIMVSVVACLLCLLMLASLVVQFI